MMYIQTSHPIYTTQQSSNPSCMMDGLGEIQAASSWLPHWSDVMISEGITHVQREGLTKTHQL